MSGRMGARGESTARRAMFDRLALVTVYLLGAGFWGDFLKWGRLAFTGYDWPKELLYFEVVREALLQGRLPWHITIPTEYGAFPQLNNSEVEGLCRFFALPETILSPQLVLLRWLTPGQFVLAHFLLLYTIGFVGCLGFQRRYRLGLVPFGVLVALFSCNGFVTAHAAVGHIMVGGYFFLPLFVRLILGWNEGLEARPVALGLAVVFFAMFLQGALHMVIWCALFLALASIFDRATRHMAALAVGLGGLLAGIRLVPTVLAYLHLKRSLFSGGYSTMMDIVDALVTIHEPTHTVRGGLGFWELDVHVGLLGAFLLAYWGIYRRSSFPAHRYGALDLPLFGLTLLSMGDLYKPIYDLPFPLASSERVTTRFIILPIIMLLFVAVVRLQRDLERREPDLKERLFSIGALAVLAWEALAHSRVWWLGAIERLPDARWHAFAPAVISDVADAPYVQSVIAGTVTTVAAGGLVGYLLLRHRRASAA